MGQKHSTQSTDPLEGTVLEEKVRTSSSDEKSSTNDDTCKLFPCSCRPVWPPPGSAILPRIDFKNGDSTDTKTKNFFLALNKALKKKPLPAYLLAYNADDSIIHHLLSDEHRSKLEKMRVDHNYRNRFTWIRLPVQCHLVAAEAFAQAFDSQLKLQGEDKHIFNIGARHVIDYTPKQTNKGIILQADAAWTENRLNSNSPTQTSPLWTSTPNFKWPNVVVICGWAHPDQTLRRGRADLWIVRAYGAVRVVLFILVSRDRSEITLETWSWRRTCKGKWCDYLEPCLMSSTRVSRDKLGEYNVSGDPFFLGLGMISRRKGLSGRCDFDQKSLAQIAQSVWEERVVESVEQDTTKA